MSEDTQEMELAQEDKAKMEAAQLEALKARAVKLGVPFSPNIGLATLRERIAEHTAETPAVAEAPVEVKAETEQQRRQRIRKAATRLVRVRVTNMNPATNTHEGQYFTAGNSVCGDHTKYVKYDVPWHVPYIIYQYLKEREIQMFRTSKNASNKEVKESYMAKEFSVEVLPALTPKELEDLRIKQAMANNID